MFTSLDIRTLLLVITVLMVCRAVLLAFVWRLQRQYLPLGLWAIGATLVAAGALLIGLRDVTPAWLSVVVAQTLVLAGWLLTDGATVRAASGPMPWRIGVALAALGAAGVLWFLAVTPDYVGRTVAVTVPEVLFDAYAAACCLRAPPNRRRVSLRVLGALLVLAAAANLWKLWLIAQGASTHVFDSSAATLPFYGLTMVMLISATVLYVLLSAQSLQEQLDHELELGRRNEENLRLAAAVFESSNEGVMITDPDSTIVRINPAFAAITGYSATEAVGQSPRLLKSGRHEPAFYLALQAELQNRGQWEGEIWNRHKEGHLYAVWLTISTIRDDLGAALWRVALFHDVTTQKRSAENVFQQANFDRLTGLPNRYCFFDRLSRELSRARRNQAQVALLYLDLDRFKPVNDEHGHDAGDVVLQAVAQRWQACVRSADTLARLGGDEFALIATGLSSEREVGTIAQKLIHALNAPIALPDGASCTLDVSVGIALYPVHAQEMDSLMSAADAAMYTSKAAGPGRWTLCAAQPEAVSSPDDWVVFDDSHRVGVASIDAQHMELVRRVNHINRSIRHNPDDPELRGQFDALVAYAAEHFAFEESLMAAHRYPDLRAHSDQHARLTHELQDVLGRFEPGDELRLLQTTKDWLLGHIQVADRALGSFLQSLHVD